MVDPVLKQLLSALREGQHVAMATIVHTRGHCPREAGAKMLVWRNGRTAGTIGGGCGENQVRLAAAGD